MRATATRRPKGFLIASRTRDFTRGGKPSGKPVWSRRCLNAQADYQVRPSPGQATPWPEGCHFRYPLRGSGRLLSQARGAMRVRRGWLGSLMHRLQAPRLVTLLLAAAVVAGCTASPSTHDGATSRPYTPKASKSLPATKASGGSASTMSPTSTPTISEPQMTTTTQPVAAGSTTATSQRTIVFPPCIESNFATTVTTNQSTYAAGVPVNISVTLHNVGPACTENNIDGYGCLYPTVSNSSGGQVWVPWAPYLPVDCPYASGPPTQLATGWSQEEQWTWTQDACSTLQSCPKSQVPPGQYEVVGTNWNGTSSAPVTITITSSSSGPTSTTITNPSQLHS